MSHQTITTIIVNNMGVYNGSATGPELDAAAELAKALSGVQIKCSAATFQNGTCCLLGQLAVLYSSIQVIGTGYKFINVIITRESTAVYRMYGQITGFKIYVDSTTNNVYLLAPSGTAIRPVVMTYHPSNILNCTSATLPSGATEITLTA